MIYLITSFIYSQEIEDNETIDEDYYDIGMSPGITIYGERQEEYDSESMDAYVLHQINGSLADRKQFLETDFLSEAGFRRTANVKYRKTEPSEKAISLLRGFFRVASLGLLPISLKPFFETEHDRLPRGEYYKFESIIIKSQFIGATPEVLTIIELEYMLQIEFFHGAVIHDNIKYYTDENINKFEKLILKLPDYPESINQAKTRYLNELQKIKEAFERYKNPSENHQRALQNLGNGF
jgi:hypothetical protein